MITPFEAVLLGVVEGLTEFLPVSSTGHLILASRTLRLGGEALKSFEIVIQGGALIAVLALYRASVASMMAGLLGRDAGGLRLLRNLFLSFLPSALVGLVLRDWIKTHLFSAWPVVWALAAGGVVMLLIDRAARRGRLAPTTSITDLTPGRALLIGLVQCAALWPGTSRSMSAIVGGVFGGLSLTAATEYSFLLALPTLGAASALELATGGQAMLAEIPPASALAGLVTAAVVAALAVKGLIRYVGRHGLAVFGWYRLALAAAVWLVAASR